MIFAAPALEDLRDAILAVSLPNGRDGILALDLGNGLDGIFFFAVENFLEGILAIKPTCDAENQKWLATPEEVANPISDAETQWEGIMDKGRDSTLAIGCVS